MLHSLKLSNAPFIKIMINLTGYFEEWKSVYFIPLYKVKYKVYSHRSNDHSKCDQLYLRGSSFTKTLFLKLT